MHLSCFSILFENVVFSQLYLFLGMGCSMPDHVNKCLAENQKSDLSCPFFGKFFDQGGAETVGYLSHFFIYIHQQTPSSSKFQNYKVIGTVVVIVILVLQL